MREVDPRGRTGLRYDVPYTPDIVAVGRDVPETRLVVEVKGAHGDATRVVSLLRSTMHDLNAPAGMVVFPGRIILLHDFYDAQDLSSIREVADVPTDDDAWLIRFLADQPRVHESSMQTAVQAWLQRLAASGDVSDLPVSMREPIQRWVAPLLIDADIRAAWPRWRRAVGT